MASDAGVSWTAIVLTCQDKDGATAYHTELEYRQKSGHISENTIILTVEDPKSSVGSGGATLNALLVVSEYISARQGFTVVNADVLSHAHILILHMGRNFPSDPCGRAFVPLPLQRTSHQSQSASLVTNLDVLLSTVTQKLAVGSPPGVWVCSSDMLLSVPQAKDFPKWDEVEVCAISVPAKKDYAQQHGVFWIGEDGFVKDIIYRSPSSAISKCSLPNGSVPLVAGVVFFSHQVAEQLLAFHVMPPLDACTYMGLDSGAKPIQLSIFFDVMLAMCNGLSEKEFVTNRCSKELFADPAVENARRRIWKDLHSFNVTPWIIQDGCHSYMNLKPNTHHSHMTNCPMTSSDTFKQQRCIHSIIQANVSMSESAIVINSILDEGSKIGDEAVVAHSHIPNGSSLGSRSSVLGLSMPDTQQTALHLPDAIVLQAFNIKVMNRSRTESSRVFTLWGQHDDLEKPVSHPEFTFCGLSWEQFKKVSGLCNNDLWPTNLRPEQCCLLQAMLFPVFHPKSSVGLVETLWLADVSKGKLPTKDILERWRSSCRLSMSDILSCVNIGEEMAQRRKLFFEIGQLQIRDILSNRRDVGLGSLYASAAVEGCAQDLLRTLDEVAMECSSPGIAARTLANIADMLGAMSHGHGGLRSGPAGNKEWAEAFALLEAGKIKEGVAALSRIRGQWQSRADHLVRAARHYEGAAQILIRHAVMTAREFISTKKCEPAPMGKWTTASCPARVDIAGGWSDTPPITYEHGGAVTNAAITIDGKKPIGAKVKRIPEPHLVLVLCGDGGSDTKMTLTDLIELADYSQPHSPGALLKAAFICTEIVEFPSHVSLEDQLRTKYGGGFELHTWSNLPHGSGLGTSSILAGAVMAVLWRSSGRSFNIESLNHGVLHLEQMLTTGGGWQDQVGGLSPGIKMGHSAAQLPLKVDIHRPVISPETVKKFGEHLVLVYTGKTRLARNLLQNVIRNWYARNPDIVQTEDDLVKNAEDCAKAFEEGDLKAVGACLSEYWRLKKKMASGCEPIAATRMIAALDPYVWGISLAGAGGGGFMYVFTKEPNATGLVADILADVPGTENITIHKAAVDSDGLTLEIEGQGRIPVEFKT